MNKAQTDFRRSSTIYRAGWWLILVVMVVAALPVLAAAKVTARAGEITLPTYGWAANKHPHFRGTDGRNIYPYPMLDFLSRDKTNRTYRTVILENEYLRITFLPELGGKIHEVLDKTTGHPVFYVNHVIKPGLIGQCGAWTSGGVEWNTGPQGHTVSCMQPVDVVILPPEKDGSRSVAIGETERIYRTKWTVVVTLRPGRSFIEERIRIYNPTETIRPHYFWNCTAVPNTPGFRFIYPMTLGCDHAGEKFFNWPVDNGKDLTRGTNYQDASSIFAYNCDQDFFGSYNDDLDRGVVAYANHHQLPGKKAWTWGHGGYGKMHQMDLTDDDGPYNEVQTGPLLTQAQVGRLDPCEAVEWKEWWYPIHGIGGFTFANKDVAVKASVDGGNLNLRMIGTAAWSPVKVQVRKEANFVSPKIVAQANCEISPRSPTELSMPLAGTTEPLVIKLLAGEQTLADFRLPLDLPVRRPPPPKAKPESASELAQAGWQDFLFARFTEAEQKFNKALERDTNSVSAQTGLAYLNLERDPVTTIEHAEAALSVDPDYGLARFALAAAQPRAHEGNKVALENAWKASLDPAMAVPGRGLAAKQLLRLQQWNRLIAALSETGPWLNDPVCRNRLAIAFLHVGDNRQAKALAHSNLDLDPLDSVAQKIIMLAEVDVFGLGRSNQKPTWPTARQAETPEKLLDVVAEFAQLGEDELALRILEHRYCLIVPKENWDWLVRHWGEREARFTRTFTPTGQKELSKMPQGYSDYEQSVIHNPAKPAWPYRFEDLEALGGIAAHCNEGSAALAVGHLLFHLGRYAEGRAMWEGAAKTGAEPVIAYRALGMAAKTLDNDVPSARDWLTKANQADPKDSIVARDLANVLFALADKTDSDAEKRALATKARDRLKAAFAEGKGRSDFVALLARAQNRLGDFAETARLLDSVRVTVWEGAREVHDLFEQAHFALGEAHLEADRASEALAEFNRALEYPVNLATGKLENAREAHIHYLRGNALLALGRKPEAIAAWKNAADEPPSSDAAKEQARAKARTALQAAQDAP